MKKRIFCAIFSLVVLLNVTSVFAQDKFSIKSSFDAATGDVIISGNGEGEFAVMILSDGEDVSVLSSGNLPVDIFQIYTNGSFEKTIQLSSTATGGKYKVVAPKLGSDVYDTFVYINNEEASVVLPLDSSSFAAFYADVCLNSNKLGIDTDDEMWINHKYDICKILYAVQSSYTEAFDFYNDYYMSRALCLLNKSALGSIEGILKENELYLGISYTSDYENDTRITQDIKSELACVLKNYDYSKSLSPTKDFKSCLEEAKALASVKTADYWQDIETVLTKDFSHLFSHLMATDTYYSQVKTKQNVFSKMMDYSYDTYLDIASNFKKAAEYVYNEENPPQSPSASPSGVGGTIISTPAGITETPYVPSEDANMSEGGILHLDESAVSSFNDLDKSHWSYTAVSALNKSGVISGYEDNSFVPDGKVTRAEFAKLITVAFGIPAGDGRFSDVSSESWYYPYVSASGANGIIQGSDGLFNPDREIKREDAALMIYRALAFHNITLTGSSNFEDNHNISLYAYTAVGALRAHSIVQGSSGNVFLPANSITRAEAAQMIYNAVSTANTLLK